MAEEMKDLLTPEEEDNCTPTKEQIECYLATPDDRIAAPLKPAEKRQAAVCILYGMNIAKAQLAKVLNAPPEGGTDAISWGKGLQDGITRERKRMRLIVGGKLRFNGKPDPYNDAIRDIFEELDKGE